VLFLVGFFFELVLNIGGMASGVVAPLLLIAAGIYLLLRRVSPVARPIAAPAAVTAAPAEPSAQVSRPIGSAPAVPAEAETMELLATPPSDEQQNECEVAAHE
jgi:hypothetical protein